jgi:hypothetical protein
MSSLRLYPVLLGAATVLLVGLGLLMRGRRKTPEERERERRLRLSNNGRITDGTVLDVQEVSANGAGSLQVLIYSYDVGGVSYEAAQDVTYLRQFVDLHNCRLGLPASIKYDPQNPGNSIVIAEDWSGLRT